MNRIAGARKRLRSEATSRNRPIGYQRWRDLLFIHWAVSPADIRPLVPDALELDLSGGSAWITLIPFAIPESRPIALPVAMASRFLETNLRTYVIGPDGEPGIYFWSLEASSLVAVLGARLLYGLPYYPAARSLRREGDRVDYTSRRSVGRDAALTAACTIGPPLPSGPGTREHFLVERYALYVLRRRHVYRARVRHPPYRLRHAYLCHLAESITRAAGLPAHHAPALCHYSAGVDVEIFWRWPVWP